MTREDWQLGYERKPLRAAPYPTLALGFEERVRVAA